jgi:hypothetical protein
MINRKQPASFASPSNCYYRERNARLLSHLALSYLSKIEDIPALASRISPVDLKRAVNLLAETRLDSAALLICDCFGYFPEAIDILARRGQADELSRRLSRDDITDKELLQTAVRLWEKYNGNIGRNLTLGNMLIHIAQYAPESIPDNPHARETIGQYKEAAICIEFSDRQEETP